MALEGITINDSIFFDIGITQAGTYATFCDSTIRIVPSTEHMKWNVHSKACIFINKSQCDNNCDPLQKVDVQIENIDRTTLNNSDVITLLLNELKTKYTDTTDVTMM